MASSAYSDATTSLFPTLAGSLAQAGVSIPPRVADQDRSQTVADLVARWFGSVVRGPYRLPIAWTEREGLAKGYLVEADVRRNPLTAFFQGATTIAPQRERIAALAPAFAALHARFRAFQSDEAALATLLDREIDAGIVAAWDNSDTSS